MSTGSVDLLNGNGSVYSIGFINEIKYDLKIILQSKLDANCSQHFKISKYYQLRGSVKEHGMWLSKQFIE